MEASPNDRRLTIYIDPESIRWLRTQRVETGKSVSDIADKMITNQIREQTRKEKVS